VGPPWPIHVVGHLAANCGRKHDKPSIIMSIKGP
jgi:hypothetical protein